MPRGSVWQAGRDGGGDRGGVHPVGPCNRHQSMVYARLSGTGRRAALLDGGFALWKKEGRAVSTEARLPGRTLHAAPAPVKVASAEWIRMRLKDPGVMIIDARAPEYQRREQRWCARADSGRDQRDVQLVSGRGWTAAIAGGADKTAARGGASAGTGAGDLLPLRIAGDRAVFRRPLPGPRDATL